MEAGENNSRQGRPPGHGAAGSTAGGVSGGLSEGRCLHCQQAWSRQGTVIEHVCPFCGGRLDSRVSDVVLPHGTRLQGGLFVLRSCIGKGGFGITYTAEMPVMGPNGPTTQIVCVKELFHGEETWRDAGGRVNFETPHPDSPQSALRKFQREIEALARIRHPNIVRILRSFVENGTAYFVMDYVEGLTLKQRLRDLNARDIRMPEPEVRRICTEIIEALAVIHHDGLTHLDIKPANIMLARDGRVVLIDFGAVRIVGSEHTTVGVGSVGYAPLEVLAGEEVGPESDIYELGNTLHEMLTGKLPPPASQRKHGWRADYLPAPWRALVESALTIRQDSRPKDVFRWWNSVNWDAWEKNLRARGEDPELTKKMPRESLAALWNAAHEASISRSTDDTRSRDSHPSQHATSGQHRTSTASQRIRETWNGWPMLARGAFTLSVAALVALMMAIFARPRPVGPAEAALPSAASPSVIASPVPTASAVPPDSASDTSVEGKVALPSTPELRLKPPPTAP